MTIIKYILFLIFLLALWNMKSEFNAKYPTNDYWASACKAVAKSTYERGGAPIECQNRYAEGKLQSL